MHKVDDLAGVALAVAVAKALGVLSQDYPEENLREEAVDLQHKHYRVPDEDQEMAGTDQIPAYGDYLDDVMEAVEVFAERYPISYDGFFLVYNENTKRWSAEIILANIPGEDFASSFVQASKPATAVARCLVSAYNYINRTPVEGNCAQPKCCGGSCH